MRLRSPAALFVIVALTYPVVLHASPERECDDKAPWRWTNEERAATRVDPVKVRERARAAGEEPPPNAHSSQATTNYSPKYNPNHFVVHGSQNPELLMPWELFVWVLAELDFQDDNDGAVRQNRYRIGLREVGWKEDEFWQRLRQIAAATREIQKRNNALEREARTANPIERRRLAEEIMIRGREACRARTLALQDARMAFGEVEFDKFLYTVVAPGIEMPSESTEVERHHLIWVEGGCQ